MLKRRLRLRGSFVRTFVRRVPRIVEGTNNELTKTKNITFVPYFIRTLLRRYEGMIFDSLLLFITFVPY